MRKSQQVSTLIWALASSCASPSAAIEQAPTVSAPEPSAASSDVREQAQQVQQTRPAPEVPEVAEPPSWNAEIRALMALSPTQSTSVASPNNGSLTGGIAFPIQAAGVIHNPRRRRAAAYGTIEVVQAIVAAAGSVEEAFPGSLLVVNDLCLETGGPIAQHASHQSGRDADILFYLRGPDGEAIRSVGAPIDPDGRGTDYRDLAISEDNVPLTLDVERTWRFVQALLESESATVQRIFIAEHIRAMLLAHARTSPASAPIIERFEMVTCQPSSPHDDHLHVRFFCSNEDLNSGCEDRPPIYPWRQAQLDEVGQSVVLTRRPRRRAQTTSPEQARAAAGEMHPEVVAFLDRRQEWIEQPHPGRRFCR